jgi:hypothetical protein
VQVAGELWTAIAEEAPIAAGEAIGRRLVARVADRLMQQGHCSMLVWVLTTNPSRLFYEALGGVEVAEKGVTVSGVNLVEVS